MRLIGSRTAPEEVLPPPNATTADIVLQLGSAKIPLKAEKLLGGVVKVTGQADGVQKVNKPRAPFERAANDEDKAIEALSRMQEALSGPTEQQNAGRWTPWSPDDLYPYSRQPNLAPHHTGDRHTPDALRREPSDANLPGYYDPASQPYNVSQQAPTPGLRRDMALPNGVPTIFDNFGEARSPADRSSQAGMKQHEARRSKTTGHSGRSRRLDLVQLFPQPRPATGRILSPSALSQSPSGLTDRALPPLPSEAPHSMKRLSRIASTARSSRPRPSTSAGPAGKKKVFDEDIFDQHKTNVRRPPKGIQNWFDAYLESDDEDDDDDEDEDDDEKGENDIPRPPPAPEPQELPAEDVLPPAYSAPSRDVSRASDKHPCQTRSLDPIRDDQQAAERFAVREEMNRYRSTSECHSWDSIQSSHIGRVSHEPVRGQLGRSDTAAQSVLSLSASEYTDDDDDEPPNPNLPPIRDSIFVDDRNITVAAASSIDLHRMPRPQHLEQMRSFSRESHLSKQSSRSSEADTPVTQRRDKPLPFPPNSNLQPMSEQAALRRLNGMSAQSHTSSSSETALQAPAGGPSDAEQHLMAVSEEEKMLLDIMRKKRAALQQMSFTEGYQLALQAEQQRLAKRTASAEHSALKALKRQEVARRDSQMGSAATPSIVSGEVDMRRQLSAIRKEQVDERFQIERFLGMSQPQPLASHPPDESPVELANNRHSGELLPATVYSPATTPSSRSPALNQGSFPSSDDNDTEEVKKRVQHFIDTRGAVPPLNTMIKTMRRKSNRNISSQPPSPVMEEQQAPAIPVRSPDRHTRGSSGSSLNHKVSSISLNGGEARDQSPVSAFPTSAGSLYQKNFSYDDLPPLPAKAYDPKKPFDSSPDLTSDTTASPALSYSMSPVSPFSTIISAAAKQSVPHPQRAPQPQIAAHPAGNRVVTSMPDMKATQRSQTTENEHDSIEVPATSETVVYSPELPPGIKRLPIPTSRFSMADLKDRQGSMISITSAGEDVLAAWAELGGNDNLKTKPKVRQSGPLSQIMNS